MRNKLTELECLQAFKCWLNVIFMSEHWLRTKFVVLHLIGMYWPVLCVESFRNGSLGIFVKPSVQLKLFDVDANITLNMTQQYHVSNWIYLYPQQISGDIIKIFVELLKQVKPILQNNQSLLIYTDLNIQFLKTQYSSNLNML